MCDQRFSLCNVWSPEYIGKEGNYFEKIFVMEKILFLSLGNRWYFFFKFQPKQSHNATKTEGRVTRGERKKNTLGDGIENPMLDRKPWINLNDRLNSGLVYEPGYKWTCLLRLTFVTILCIYTYKYTFICRYFIFHILCLINHMLK